MSFRTRTQKHGENPFYRATVAIFARACVCHSCPFMASICFTTQEIANLYLVSNFISEKYRLLKINTVVGIISLFLVSHCVYSGTSLIRTPLGQKKVS